MTTLLHHIRCPLRRTSWSIAILTVTVVLAPRPASAEEADGFTEPYQTINVAAAESGIIVAVSVREGDPVKPNQVLATLDNDVHLALLAIAKAEMNAQGHLDSALAELSLKTNRLKQLESLYETGHARHEEVEKARAEEDMAKGQISAVREGLLIKGLQYKKIEAQIARRTIRSPIVGVVSAILKHKGEFVTPNSPGVVTIVQLDPVLAVFSVMSPQAINLRKDQTVTIRLVGGRLVKGTIDVIAPVINAESDTVRIKVRIDNSDGSWRSGERCKLLLK